MSLAKQVAAWNKKALALNDEILREGRAATHWRTGEGYAP
jgi:hypothetical protein